MSRRLAEQDFLSASQLSGVVTEREQVSVGIERYGDRRVT
jgi:hypothetical protein